MLNPVSEPLVRKILPALRKIVAQKLHSRGFTQSEIADMMDLTQPAVSQYINNLRGKVLESIQEDEDLDRITSSIASAIAEGDREKVKKAYIEFCHILIEKKDFDTMVGYNRDFFVEI